MSVLDSKSGKCVAEIHFVGTTMYKINTVGERHFHTQHKLFSCCGRNQHVLKQVFM